jgi:hypothetical protein
MRRFDRPKTRYTVRKKWFALYPKRRWDMGFWVSVAKRVREERVRHDDTTKVRNICCDVDARMRALGR